MKQKILLILVVGFLITIPAWAGHASPPGTHVGNASDFGSKVHMPFGTTGNATTIANSKLSLTIDVEIRSDGIDGSLIAYIYKLTMTQLTNEAVAITGFGYDTLGGFLFSDAPGSWGWVDSAVNSVSPFSLDATIMPLAFALDGSFALDSMGSSIELILYAKSLFLPLGNSNPPPTFQLLDLFIETGTGGQLRGAMVGPDLNGGGASFDVPEASSLLLLTFGLLSGGVLRFRPHHNFSGKRK